MASLTCMLSIQCFANKKLISVFQHAAQEGLVAMHPDRHLNQLGSILNLVILTSTWWYLLVLTYLFLFSFCISVFHLIFISLYSSITFTLNLFHKHQQKSCVMVCNTSNGKWKQKYQKFGVILIYIASSRPAWGLHENLFQIIINTITSKYQHCQCCL